MKQNFRNLLELNDYFKEEKTCHEFLASQIWEGGKPVCPFCGSTKIYTTKSRSTKTSKKDVPEYRCADKTCTKKFSVTKGTIFESTNIPLRTWYAAIYLITTHKKGISSLQLSRDLTVTQKTAWHLLHRVRAMYKETAPELLNNMVEVDETYIGGKMKNKHKSIRYKAHIDNVSHNDNKTCVVGLLERNNKVKTHVHTNKSQTLKDMVRQHVDKSATVFTDSLNAYKGLDKEFSRHEIVNHHEEEYVRGEVYTNSIEGFFSILKRGIYGIYHQVSVKHLHRYCEEFAYRYNTRKDTTEDRFINTIKNASGARLKYDDLIKD